MKKFVYSFFALLAIMAFASCTKEASLPDTPPTKEENSNNGEGVFIPLELSFELYDFEKEEPGTKSAMAGAYAKEVPSNINYYLFRNGTLVKQQYISDITKFGVQLPDKTASYNLYLLANVEQQTLPANTSESSIGSALSVVYSTQESFLQMCQSYGFPMAKKIEGFSATSSRAIMLERLVHILHVKMDISALAEEYFNEFEFTKLEVRNAAGNINPFAAASKASSILPKGDYAISPEDLAKVNSGEDVVLYVIENMRGNVFSTCSSWKERIPSNIRPRSESNVATYIEFSARVKTATSEYDNVTFRTYLGTSVTNCNVQRNVVSTVTNSFLMDMISSDEWRIEPDDPNIQGTLRFVDADMANDKANMAPQRGENATISKFYLTKDFTKTIFLERSNPGIEVELTLPSASGQLSYTVGPWVNNTKRIDISCDNVLQIDEDHCDGFCDEYGEDFDPSLYGLTQEPYDWSTYYNWGYTYTDYWTIPYDGFTIVAKSKDGLLRTTVSARLLSSAVQYYNLSGNGPLSNLTTPTRVGEFKAMGISLLGLSLTSRLVYKVIGYCEWKNSGLGSWNSAECEVYGGYEADYYIYPDDYTLLRGHDITYADGKYTYIGYGPSYSEVNNHSNVILGLTSTTSQGASDIRSAINQVSSTAEVHQEKLWGDKTLKYYIPKAILLAHTLSPTYPVTSEIDGISYNKNGSTPEPIAQAENYNMDTNEVPGDHDDELILSKYNTCRSIKERPEGSLGLARITWSDSYWWSRQNSLYVNSSSDWTYSWNYDETFFRMKTAVRRSYVRFKGDQQNYFSLPQRDF